MLTSVSNDDNLTIVSIGLPVFNSEKTIADAIKTIINQSFENWEFFYISKKKILECSLILILF